MVVGPRWRWVLGGGGLRADASLIIPSGLQALRMRPAYSAYALHTYPVYCSITWQV